MVPVILCIYVHRFSSYSANKAPLGCRMNYCKATVGTLKQSIKNIINVRKFGVILTCANGLLRWCD